MAGFPLSRRLAAEALGTAALLASVVGSGIMGERLAGGSVALALLGNTLATGAMLCVLIAALGPVSGAHFNPAVTLVMALRRDISVRDAALYVAVQVPAAVAGVAIAHAMFDLAPLAASQTVRAGPAQMFAEAVATFGLVATILGALRFRPESVAPLVGLYIAAGYWFTASTAFANPAVTVARSLTDTFSGIRPADASGFIAAEIVGALAAGWLCAWLFAPRAASAK